MDKFDSLRKSIRQILEQEEKQKKVVRLKEFDSRDYTDEERAKLDRYSQLMIDDALSQQKPKNGSMSQDSAMDDVEVKDTAAVVDKKVIDDILYRNKYKIGYVEYNGLMHLLCVLKVYGQNNPLPKDLKDFINLVRDYILGLSESYNISNNRLLESPNLPNYSTVEDLQKDIEKILKYFYISDEQKSETLLRQKSYSISKIILKVNNNISQALGFFTEILFYTYITDVDVQSIFPAVKDTFKLQLGSLLTNSTKNYRGELDFCVMYFRLYDIEDKGFDNTIDKNHEYIKYDQFNHRKEDVNYFANKYSFKFDPSLQEAMQVLKKLKDMFDESIWITGKKETNTSEPEYDLWLVNKNPKIKKVYAKVDIKSYLPKRKIGPTSVKHSQVGKADYYGFINFERSSTPFTFEGFGNLEYSLKYFIIQKDEVQSLLKDGVFALGDGDSYQLKTYKEDDLKSESPFTLEKYYSEEKFVDTSYDKSTNNVSTEKSVKQRRKITLPIWPPDNGISEYIEIYNIGIKAAQRRRHSLQNRIKAYIVSKIGADWKNKERIDLEKICKFVAEYLKSNIDEKLALSYQDECPDEIEVKAEQLLADLYRHFHFSFSRQVYHGDKQKASSSLGNYQNPKSHMYKPKDVLFFKNGILKDYFDEAKKAIKWSQNKKSEESTTETSSQQDSHNISGNPLLEKVLKHLVRKQLLEAEKKSYSGSHPEESYGWSAKEEHFMFDMPGLTTWEKDRQRVKEYLRSMGMLAPKKEKKK